MGWLRDLLKRKEKKKIQEKNIISDEDYEEGELSKEELDKVTAGIPYIANQSNEKKGLTLEELNQVVINGGKYYLNDTVLDSMQTESSIRRYLSDNYQSNFSIKEYNGAGNCIKNHIFGIDSEGSLTMKGIPMISDTKKEEARNEMSQEKTFEEQWETQQANLPYMNPERIEKYIKDFPLGYEEKQYALGLLARNLKQYSNEEIKNMVLRKRNYQTVADAENFIETICAYPINANMVNSLTEEAQTWLDSNKTIHKSI